MAKKKRTKSSGSNALPWKKVNTAELPEPVDKTKNHYDNGIPSQQLQAEPGESVAIFYGLEVLQPNQYTVNEFGKFQSVNKSNDQVNTEELTRNQEKNVKSSETTSTKKRKATSDEPTSEEEQPSTLAATNDNDDKAIDESEKQARKSKKKKKKKNKKAATNDETVQQQQVANEQDSTTDSQVERLQTSWMIATGGVELHPQLCRALLQQKFWTPTPIQSATLPAAILGRRNVVGAAPTGSGKTLAYLLPILSFLLQHNDDNNASRKALQALILTPTRELALQVSNECELLLPNRCGTIVGGLAHAKQERVLQKKRPPILVATPGRLWDLMSSGQHKHLTDLSQLQFLVVDEADRMLGQGSFPQLVNIFDVIHTANPMDDSDDEMEEEDDLNNDDDDDRMLGLPGIRGEAKVEMLNDVLERMGHQQLHGAEEEPEPVEIDDEEFQELQMQQENDEDDDDISLPAAPPVHRQTFVYSATLTLPPFASYVAKDTKMNKKRKDAKKDLTVDGAIAEILEKARAKGQTKVVDLTSSDKHFVLAPTTRKGAAKVTSKETSSSSAVTSSSRLPPGLSLHKIECTQRHKDSHLYAYLVTTRQGASGPCLVFCNSIAAVRRVGKTLQSLRLPARMLHANMQQKARLKAVESLREPRSIVVATDIAARGLDIPSVATVVHYDVARHVDTFIHRSGRTARGMGKDAVGASVSLIAPGEDKAHNKVCEALNSKHLFEVVEIDGRLLAAAQERVNLVAKIVECDDVESRAQKSNKWFQDAAEEAGLDLDEDMLDEGLAGGDLREQHKLREAKAARGRLRHLLAQPMQTQRFGKFLSSYSAAADPEVAAFVAPPTNDRMKKKRKGKRR